MYASEIIPEGLITITKAFGCENIVECFIEPRTWLQFTYSGVSFPDGWKIAQEKSATYFEQIGAKRPFGYPVAIKITPGDGPTCESQFMFNFTLPHERTDLPQPKSPDLRLDKWSRLHVYARPFLGPATEEGFSHESLKFAEEMRCIKLKFIPEPYYWIMGSTPGSEPTHTQVWFEVEQRQA